MIPAIPPTIRTRMNRTAKAMPRRRVSSLRAAGRYSAVAPANRMPTQIATIHVTTENTSRTKPRYRLIRPEMAMSPMNRKSIQFTSSESCQPWLSAGTGHRRGR